MAEGRIAVARRGRVLGASAVKGRPPGKAGGGSRAGLGPRWGLPGVSFSVPHHR